MAFFSVSHTLHNSLRVHNPIVLFWYHTSMEPTRIPKLLREIPDKPEKLYLLGKLPNEDEYTFLTFVGSRKYSPYGKMVTEKIIEGLRGYPFVIVSGLALGIDGIAHRTAIENGLPTIAIPGSGLSPKVLYPASHRSLAENILRSGGALLSEFEPEQKANTWTFPKRNRIMAGISHATVVIEAEQKSGTRITARLATEYNRDVFAVPGSIFSPSSEGCNELIKEGAYPLTSAEDLIRHFQLEGKTTHQEEILLSPEEEQLLELLARPRSRDALAREMGLPIFRLNILLSSLEMRGIIGESMGKIHRKI